MKLFGTKKNTKCVCVFETRRHRKSVTMGGHSNSVFLEKEGKGEEEPRAVIPLLTWWRLGGGLTMFPLVVGIFKSLPLLQNAQNVGQYVQALVYLFISILCTKGIALTVLTTYIVKKYVI